MIICLGVPFAEIFIPFAGKINAQKFLTKTKAVEAGRTVGLFDSSTLSFEFCVQINIDDKEEIQQIPRLLLAHP